MTMRNLIDSYRDRVRNGEAFFMMRGKRSQRSLDAPDSNIQTLVDGRHAVAIQVALLLEGKRKWTTVTGNPKLAKSPDRNVGITTSPADEATPFLLGTRHENYNACPGAVAACIFVCVGAHTGQGRLESSKIARIGKTTALLMYREESYALLVAELTRHVRIAERSSVECAVRANVASDKPARAARLARSVPGATFYDYTAIPSALNRTDRVRRTLSYKGPSNLADCLDALASGHPITVVADIGADDPKPSTLWGYPAIDGDKRDEWYQLAPVPVDHAGPQGAYVNVLYLKGNNAQKDEARRSGFAVDLTAPLSIAA